MRFAKDTQHDTSKVLRLPRKMTMDTSKVLRLPRKLQHIFWKPRKSIAPATQNDFRQVPEHVWMSRSATPATRNEATPRLKPSKMTTSAELPIGTAIWSSRGRLRTVADGCERLRPWTQRRANTPSTPRPPEWNGNPCYAFGKKPLPLKEAPPLKRTPLIQVPLNRWGLPKCSWLIPMKVSHDELPWSGTSHISWIRCCVKIYAWNPMEMIYIHNIDDSKKSSDMFCNSRQESHTDLHRNAHRSTSVFHCHAVCPQAMWGPESDALRRWTPPYCLMRSYETVIIINPLI